MTRLELLEGGRAAALRSAWRGAFEALSAADREAPLDPVDLERLAEAGHLLGKQAECAALLARAHRGYLDGGDAVAAARCAFWLAFGAFHGGEPAQAAGWLARAERLLDDGAHDCGVRGYLLALRAIGAFGEGDVAGAQELFVRVASIGQRFGEPDLIALGRCGQGRSLLRQGDLAGGVRLLDEAMAAVQAGDVSPRVAGGVYCTMLEACEEVLDLRRAQEWTDALDRWCRSQPDMVPYRGACLVRRAQLLELHGAWPEALEEARRAGDWLSRPRPGPPFAAALHLVGDLHRLRGELDAAEEAYRQASPHERAPHPGLALLWLAQGRIEAARAAVRAALEARHDDAARATALEAMVEVALAARDLEAARSAAAELQAIAGRLRAPHARALAAGAAGAVLLAEGDARGALTPLREALALWSEAGARYRAARIQLSIALACRAGQDCDAAELELDHARGAFERLGAAPDLARIEALERQGRPDVGLTAREVEVLVLVASGRTNRAIAAHLRLSEKTVARHLSNIFGKLGVASRAAATAYAYQHELVSAGGRG